MYTLIIDIDGTVANAEHRLHHIQKTPKDWNAFYEQMGDDEPIYPVIEMINAFYAQHSPNAYVVTGRPERYRDVTMDWLERYCSWGPYSADLSRNLTFDKLLMRKDDDHRADYIVKAERTSWLPKGLFNDVIVFEDRDRCVQMWRSRGFTVFQPTDGAY
jgi:hypothetical protein